MNCWAVVAAAGRGERAGLGVNKVFSPLAGRSVLSRCLEALAASGCFAGAVLVLSPADEAAYRELCAREGGENPLVRAVVAGGATRQASVFNGLRALPPEAELVAIHDAARPFVGAPVIAATLEAAARWGSGVICTPVTDTIRRLDAAGTGSTTLPREALRAVQTPQSFRTAEILRAHEAAAREGVEATDDAALYERYVGPVRLVEAAGAEENVKLTNRGDFERLRGGRPAVRVGSGYDAHRLKAGRRLVLCGVEVPHDRGLDGHSDADVALHALMDALLGALGEGDIGRHFPDSDEAYRGISSMALLDRVLALVRARGYRVGNADVTIVAQRPKLAPYMQAMRESVARGLEADLERVNVKATTTERMGFEGEEIGISAQAVVLLERVNEG